MTAREITARLILEIPRRFPARAWRRNVGAFTDAAGHFVRAGIPGESDIDGIVAPHGRRLCIEVKAGRDRQSEAQRSFQRMIEAHGGIYLIAHDVENALSDLKERIESQQ